MKQRYFDAHFHWFENSEFGENLAKNIGDASCSRECYIDTYCNHGTLAGGIVMGNGDIRSQGRDIPEGFYYSLGLDSLDQVNHLKDYLDVIEQHLQNPKCVGVKIYPGYISIYPNSGHYNCVYELLVRYQKVLSVHTGMMAGNAGRLKYSHPLCLDDVAVDYPDLKIVMCHFGNPFLSEAAAVLEKNPNVYADLSGLIEGPFEVQEIMKKESGYMEILKSWIHYVEHHRKFMFGTDWPAVKCDTYADFILGFFPEENHADVLMNNALRIYNIKDNMG